MSGMLMFRGEIWGWTGFTGDSGASRFAFFPLGRAVNMILMFVLGNLNVHLQEENRRVRNHPPVLCAAGTVRSCRDPPADVPTSRTERRSQRTTGLNAAARSKKSFYTFLCVGGHDRRTSWF